MTPHNNLITIPTIEDLTRREFMSSALAAALLIACGDDEGAPADGGMVTIDDYFGPVTIPANPQRVIAADAQTMAAMLNLGVTPVGSYFVSYTGFPAYLGVGVDEVQDVTLAASSEIDLEKALALDPDLMVTIVGTNDNVFLQDRYERYRQVVPTFGWMREYRSLAGHEEGFVAVGRALGLEERAREMFADIHARIASLRERVMRLPAPPRVNVVQLSSDRVRARFNEAPPSLIPALGLQWALPNPGSNVDISLEQIRLLEDADVLFVLVNVDAGGYFTELQSNPLWRGLKSVQSNRAHAVDLEAWVATDPKAFHVILDDIERYVIEPAERR